MSNRNLNSKILIFSHLLQVIYKKGEFSENTDFKNAAVNENLINKLFFHTSNFLTNVVRF